MVHSREDNWFMIKMRNLRKSDDAVVGIVVAFLITGLIVAVISIIQTVYIPKWMEQAEADHMEMVADQFSQLKFAIDTQSAIKKPNTPISTSITLGNKEMPFLTSSRSYGSLEILSERCKITITPKDADPVSYSLGVIKYSSVNTYFLDQAYIYEAGAVIISQDEGDTMSIKPAFTVDKQDEASITFTLTNISTIGNKRSINGYGTYPIQTEYPSTSPTSYLTLNNITSLKFETNYKNSWKNFINKTLINSGLEYNTHFSITTDTDSITVNFVYTTYTTNIDLQVVEIDAQIAPGWIENIKGNY